MSKARDLGDLLDTDGDVVSDSLDNVPTPSKTSIEALGIDLPAANLTGTIADARIPSTVLNSNAITKSTSEPTISTNPSGGVGTTWLRTTTGEMYCCTDATAGANVWTNIGDGTDDITPFTGMVATGGTVTTDGDYKVHTFTTGGTFSISNLGTYNYLDYLVIGGGGGAGGDNGGGGGAGAYRTDTGFTVTATSYGVTVGAGGTPGHYPSTCATPGQASIFSTISSAGGGNGSPGACTAGSSAGSGGGGSRDSNTAGTGGAYGNNGGTGNQGGGGGGGSGSAGQSCSTTTGPNSVGDGGQGTSSSITGSSVTRAGGGGGGANQSAEAYYGAAGSGGAGRGKGGAGTSTQSYQNANVNSGSGGGGGGQGTSSYGGNGGSGVVILRYKYQ
jgi:hypothetical protein